MSEEQQSDVGSIFDESCFAYLLGNYSEALSLMDEALNANETIVQGTDKRDPAKEFLKRLISLETELKKEYSENLHLRTRLFARPKASLDCSFCGRSNFDGINILAGYGGQICNECWVECGETFTAVQDEKTILIKGEQETALPEVNIKPQTNLNKRNRELCCSFCGKHNNEVRKLIAGPATYICNECVDICNEILSDGVSNEPPSG